MQHTNPESWAQVTPADLFRCVLRRLPSVCFTTLLVTAIVVGLLIAWPNRYGSDGMMYVRLGRGALTVDPTTQSTEGVSMQENRSSEVMSVAEMMASREIAERVVDAIGVDEIVRPRNWVDRAEIWVSELVPSGGVPGDTMTQEEYEVQIAREEAIRMVTAWLKVELPKKGYTVAISGRGSDPLLIQRVVQSAMNEYGQYHVEAHQSNGSLEFFEEQVEQSRKIAIAANEELQKTRSEKGWMSVESAESTVRERLVAIEIALNEAESGYAEAQSRADGLSKQLASLKPWVPMEITSGIASAAADDMRTRLFSEQVTESEELAKLKPNHPRYQMMQGKMTRSQQIVGDQSDERTQTTEAINPVYQSLESEYLLATAKAAGLASRRDALQESLARAKKDLQRLNSDSIVLANLKWQADIGQQNFLDHSKSLEEARIIRELDKQSMSDVTVIQNASLNLKKVGPPRAMLAGVGVCLGLALGLFQAIVRDNPVDPRSDGNQRIKTYRTDGDDSSVPKQSERSGSSREQMTNSNDQDDVLVSSGGGVIPR
ncbi:GumC family protein [Stieleria varia]|uniref:Chain length determinant protein n=1 Tax=Stieleria varia TaxID=2528005 RepID=A0A5C6A6G8_9BACT|nr:exopolysaccharide biosynthesis protein [Stieleria varia]TWT94661.1 Chain length determinant protein [Stieleria varia]